MNTIGHYRVIAGNTNYQIMTPNDYDTKGFYSSSENSSSTYPPGFLAAMRFNAIQRGVKWKDSYELTSKVTE